MHTDASLTGAVVGSIVVEDALDHAQDLTLQI
jgi:hypothetical protein